MLKRFMLFLVIFLFASCGNYHNEDDIAYQRFSEIHFDLFDTVTIILGYAGSQEAFNDFSTVISGELRRLHQLYDIFNEYPDINNLMTVNNNAGIQAVEVSPEIIELIMLCIDAYNISNGVVNIALGPVTNIWREYIAEGGPSVPSMERLLEAGRLSDISHVMVDQENSTVFLRYEGMSLDVGAIAKGFAMELAVQRAINAGFASFTLSVGGDVRVASEPRRADRDAWGVGIEDGTGGIIDAVFVTDTAVFSSGNYQRYFVVDDIRYHHIIDPRTLTPADNYTAVTVIYPDGAMADILVTAAFILDIDEAKALLEVFGAEAAWVLLDGTVITTEGFALLLR